MSYFKSVAFIVAAALILFCTSGNTEAKKSGAISITTYFDSVSYIIGTDVANSLEPVKGDIDLDLFMAGLKDALGGKEQKIEESKKGEIMRKFSQMMSEKQQAQREKDNEKNIAEGKKFLEENKKREGVVTTESGLQYVILKKGTGPKPAGTDKVKVHYRGTLIDGTEFDSSIKRGQPAEFNVNAVIKGWTEALQLMPVGSKWQLYIPSDLAYGPRGAGRQIGPNETLIFEVELLDIIK